MKIKHVKVKGVEIGARSEGSLHTDKNRVLFLHDEDVYEAVGRAVFPESKKDFYRYMIPAVLQWIKKTRPELYDRMSTSRYKWYERKDGEEIPEFIFDAEGEVDVKVSIETTSRRHVRLLPPYLS